MPSAASPLGAHIENAIREMLGATYTSKVFVEMESEVVHDCDMCGIETTSTITVSAYDYVNKKRNKPAASWSRTFTDINELLVAIFAEVSDD